MGLCIWATHGLTLSFTWWHVAVQHVIKDDLYTQSQANFSWAEYLVLGTTGIPKIYVTRNNLLYIAILILLSLDLFVPTLNKSFNFWLKSSRIFPLTKLHIYPLCTMHSCIFYIHYVCIYKHSRFVCLQLSATVSLTFEVSTVFIAVLCR